MIQEPAKQHINLLIKEGDDELLDYIYGESSKERYHRRNKFCPSCDCFCLIMDSYCVNCGYFFGKDEVKNG